MEKKKDNRKIVLVTFICIALISIAIYFVFIIPNKDFKNFNSNDGRMGGSQLTPETGNEITSFFESSPSDQEIENYCLENPMHCGYYCQNNEAEFCEDFKLGGMPNETREFNYSR